MARLKDAKGKDSSGSYARLFDDTAVGRLMSRVHGASVKAGTELEHMIKERVQMIENLDEFLEQEIMHDGVFVADKHEVKGCDKLDFAGSEPDFVIFKRRGGEQRCHVVELKDGHVFDTKKAAAEHQAMHAFISKNSPHLPFTVSAHFCCFNQDSRQAIVRGYKNKIPMDEAMTGREFCRLLELDYNEIVKSRPNDGPENLRYFLSELLKIDRVRRLLKKLGG